MILPLNFVFIHSSLSHSHHHHSYTSYINNRMIHSVDHNIIIITIIHIHHPIEDIQNVLPMIIIIVIGTRKVFIVIFRHRATSRRHHTSSHSSKVSKKSFNDENEKDDSIGHYQGTVGDIINKQCI